MTIRTDPSASDEERIPRLVPGTELTNFPAARALG